MITLIFDISVMIKKPMPRDPFDLPDEKKKMSSFINSIGFTDIISTNLADMDNASFWDSAGYADSRVKIKVFAKNSDDRMWAEYEVAIETYGAIANQIGVVQTNYDERDVGAVGWAVNITIENGAEVTATVVGDSTTIEWFVSWSIFDIRADIPYP